MKKIYRVEMSEHQKSGTVVIVSATDKDIGEYAKLMYTLKTGEDAKFFKMQDIPPNAGALNVFKVVIHAQFFSSYVIKIVFSLLW